MATRLKASRKYFAFLLHRITSLELGENSSRMQKLTFKSLGLKFTFFSGRGEYSGHSDTREAQRSHVEQWARSTLPTGVL